MRHELVKLEALIDWDIFEREAWCRAGKLARQMAEIHSPAICQAKQYDRPATPPRLVAGLCSLQHAFALVTRGRRGPLGGDIFERTGSISAG